MESRSLQPSPLNLENVCIDPRGLIKILVKLESAETAPPEWLPQIQASNGSSDGQSYVEVTYT